ncbi:MAG: amidohydrolase family protein [Flavobacteriales bacterium]|nr:amidohydrolase family protein [Flavobacteriales bacterium]
MRFLTADYLYPLYKAPIKEGVLQISNKGEIIRIFENRSDVSAEKLEIFKGVLCPGFVNAHCHLELSHLLGIAEKGKGFIDFVSSSIHKRNDFTKEEILEAIEKAEQEMIANGIVAVGDICNTVDTLLQKQKGNLHYYNFIEAVGVYETEVESTISSNLAIRNQFRKCGLQATVVPHAPYSCVPQLLDKISVISDKFDKTFTFHNQEIAAENELFTSQSGAMFDWLNKIGATKTIWENRNKNSTKAVLEHFKINKPLLLVHNTFTKKKDVTDNYYCTCPKANLYIENTLPDYSIFDTEKLCVGTDSLASNDSLSILEELLIIQENSNFDMNTLLKIASKNGAEALGFSELGTFEKGKIPGVNLIQALEKVEVIA